MIFRTLKLDEFYWEVLIYHGHVLYIFIKCVLHVFIALEMLNIVNLYDCVQIPL